MSKSGLYGGVGKLATGERFFEWPNRETLSQLDAGSRIDTITFRGGDALCSLNWQYTNMVRSPNFGQQLTVGTSAQTQGLKFPRGPIPLIEVKVFGSGQENGYVQSVKFVAAGDDRTSPESLGLNTYGKNKLLAGESIEKVHVEPNVFIIGFYGVTSINDGRFKCIGFIY